MPQAYDDWVSIYNNEIQEKWKSEKLEIRKIAMIYCAFENEVKKLKASMSSEIKEIKTELRRKALMQKRQNFFGIAETLDYGLNLESTNKENETPEIEPLEEIELNCNRAEKTPEKVPLNDMLESEEIIIESPDTLAFFDNRPSTPPPPPLSELNTEVISPVLVKKNKHRKGNTTTTPSPSLIFNPVMMRNDKTSGEGKRQNEFKTPQNFDDSNIMESSIIEGTPEVKPMKKAKSKLSLAKHHSKKKLTQCKQNTTLTQMFADATRKKKKKELDSNGSSMSITAMIDLINQSSGSETDDGLDKPNDNYTTVDNLEAAGDALEDKYNITPKFVENYDKFPDKKEKMKNPDFLYHDVVRGKERKKLKGWACQECEAYYKGLNLSPEELEKKKDQCSRHRHRFQPREETFAGFWDLTFGPSPKTQEKSSDVFNFKKK